MLLLPVVLLPVYIARSRPLVSEADLSSATIAALRDVVREKGPDVVVLLRDDRSSSPSLINPFGTFATDAAQLLVAPQLRVWIDPPPDDAAVAGLQAPSRVDAELVLRHGHLDRLY